MFIACALVALLLATGCVTSTPLKPSAIESIDPVVRGDSLIGTVPDVRQRDRERLESASVPLDEIRAAWIERLSPVLTIVVTGSVVFAGYYVAVSDLK